MEFQQSKTSEFLKTMAYVAPAICRLQPRSAFAKNQSQKPKLPTEIELPNPAILDKKEDGKKGR